MLDGRILRRMSLDLHEIKFHLQGCITEEANQVRLGRYLKGHQIQYDYPKGRISCSDARKESITKICSFFSSSIAGKFFCKFNGIFYL